MGKGKAAKVQTQEVATGVHATAAADPGRRITLTKTNDSPGILVSLLSETALEDAAASRQIADWEPDSGLEQRALAMHIYNTDGEKKGQWECIVCSLCGGESDENFDTCPYCGEGSEAKAEGKDDGDDEDDARDSVPPPAPAAVPSALSGAKKSTSLAVVDGGSKALSGLKERDLDQALRRVDDFKGSFGEAFWDLGNEVRDIYDRQLWKLRPGQDRPQMWRTFEAFCNAELRMQPQSALNAMDVAKMYPREMAAKYGKSKMTYLVRADQEDRAALEKEMKQGASVRQLKEKSERLKDGKPIVERTGKVRPPSPGRTPAPKQDAITVMSLLESTATVKMWKKPTRMSMLSDPSALARAKKLGDLPVGRHELPNGVAAYITWDSTASGELVTRLKFVREDSTEAKE